MNRFLAFAIFGLFSLPAAGQNRLPAYPERYRLDLPIEWNRPKLIEAVTTVLPEALKELKDRMLCSDCRAGYTVRLVMGKPSRISETVLNKQTLKKEKIYLYTQYYTFRASLAVYDTLQNEVVELLLVDENTKHTFTKEFSVPLTVVENPQRRLPNQPWYITEEGINSSTYASNYHAQPSQTELMAIAERKLYEIRDLMRKLGN